jgi:cell division protein FtsB
VSQVDASREELEATIVSLREENARLKEEIRKIRRETNEVPPHYQ